jgi:hypothetical protein
MLACASSGMSSERRDGVSELALAGRRRVRCFIVGDPEAEPWRWPDSLDALAAAPESHRLLFENDAVRVLETRIAPGQTSQVHTHRWQGILYVLSIGHFVRRDAEGAVLVDTREAGGLPQPDTALWSGALPPHTLENVDSSEIRVINVELKDR